MICMSIHIHLCFEGIPQYWRINWNNKLKMAWKLAECRDLSGLGLPKIGDTLWAGPIGKVMYIVFLVHIGVHSFLGVPRARPAGIP